ncbi:MAG: phosphoribosylaminoimidazolesuccinocarboxamide synthase [Limnochordia bacterium]|jgi:phosphoribosylaminoimidazole-succinocarboxamide synthase
MELIYSGKTKDVLAAGPAEVLLVFKDDVTGTDAGIDPGANSVIGQLAGKGRAALAMSKYFFELLAQEGFPSHYIEADVERGQMRAKKASWLGLEYICRFKAYGSFIRRYGRLIAEGEPLPALIEITLKDDERGDPLLNDETIVALGLLRADQCQRAKELIRGAARLVQRELKTKGLELIDIKFEVGFVADELVIIDDISGDNMRVMKDGVPVDPLELSRIVCS